MKKILFSMLLAASTGVAFAQTDTANVSNDKVKADYVMTPAEQAADHHCLRYTGSHLHSKNAQAHAQKATDCAGPAGTAYSREDIERTGTTTTADALRHLDPSIH
jgi:hypothetical protein